MSQANPQNNPKEQPPTARRLERTRSGKTFIPPVDIYETPGAVVVVADLPGVGTDAVEVNVEKRVLTISGTAARRTYEGHTLAFAQYETGDFHRSFQISEELDQDKISATLKNGLLRVTLPRIQTKQKKITVTGD